MREVATEPPWSMLMSTMTDPGCIWRTRSSSTSMGALAPATSTAPMTTSAFNTCSSMVSRLLISASTPGILSTSANRSTFLSSTTTRAHARGDKRRVGTGDACTQNQHPGGGHPGRSGQQLALAAVHLLEEVGPGLGGQSPGYLAHGGEKRQIAVLRLHRLVGEAGGPAIHEPLRERLVRSKVEVGEEDVALAQAQVLLLERLLDLQQQGSPVEDLIGVEGDLRAGRGVGRIRERRARTGSGLHEHLVAQRGQLAGAGGGQGHPVLVPLDLPQDSDPHQFPSCCSPACPSPSLSASMRCPSRKRQARVLASRISSGRASSPPRSRHSRRMSSSASSCCSACCRSRAR